MPRGVYVHGRRAERLKGWKGKMRDKQIKPRREEEKESVISVEKRVMTNKEKMLLERYGIKPEWM